MKDCKKKISLAIVSAVLLALIAVALLFTAAPSSASAKELSGSLVDYTLPTDECLRISMDANGEVSNDVEDSLEALSSHNNTVTGRRYKTRKIQVLDVLQSVVKDTDKSGYKLLMNTDYKIIHNYSPDYFTVEAEDPGVDSYRYIEINALKATPANKPLRFSIVLSTNRDDGSKHTEVVTVIIEITARMIPVSNSTTATKEFFVGRQVYEDNDGVHTLDKTAQGYVDLPIRINNYNSKNIDLKKYLVGRKLYSVSPDYLGDWAEDELAAEANPNNIYKDGNGYLTLNDLSLFSINAKPRLSIIPDSAVSLFNDGELTFIVDINITSTMLSSLTALDKDVKVWGEEGKYWNLPVQLKYDGDSSDVYTVNIPIVVSPSESPKANPSFIINENTKAYMPTSLNAGSDAVFTGTLNSNTGYRAIRVYPQYLCEYSAFSDSEMIFSSADADLPVIKNTGGNTVVVPTYGEDESGVGYFEITAIGNGSANLEFKVFYRLHSDIAFNAKPAKVIPVTFTVYGQYGVNIDIAGKKTKSFTIDSQEFVDLKNAKYQIVDARLGKKREGDENQYARVTCSSGTISITPYMSILDTETASVIVTMEDMAGHVIELDCKLQIDMSKGNILAEWQTYQVVLLFVGVGIAGVLIILFFVWLFIRSVHRHKLDELQTSAPTSAYIIKLNSTIAAAQAQQRLATQPYGAQTQMLQLGAGAASAPMPNPDTLALGATPQTSTPAYSTGATMAPPPSDPTMTPPPPPAETAYAATNSAEEIVIPISDEELLQRIYEEKFEPRGMLKRTFDKSKDLQQRELQKEKDRIIEEVRGGMSMEEACKSLKQREASTASAATASTQSTAAPVEKVDPLLAILGFDPAEPIVAEVQKEEAKAGASDEEKRLKEVEYNNNRLHAELTIIESRLNAIVSATQKTETDLQEANAAVEQLNADIKTAEQTLDDKNTDLVVARGKSAKEALNKEIAELEAKIKSDKETVTAKKSSAEEFGSLLGRLSEVAEEYNGKKEATEALVATANQELESAKADAQRAADLAERARKLALLNSQLEVLNPMMQTVNALDDEIRGIAEAIERSVEEKAALKAQVSTLQTEMLSTTDASRISEISEKVKALNKEISELDRRTTANTTLKTNKNIEMTSIRRKANEYIDKEEIELDDVITAEDKIIGQLALDKLSASALEAKNRAEEAVAHWQSECDRLTESLDSNAAETVAANALRVKAAEDELAAAQLELDELTLKIDECTDEDEKLNLSMEQMTLTEKVEELTTALEVVRAEGIKANLEFRTTGEGEIENARAEYERARAEFAAATDRYNEVSVSVNPLDLIQSGSGVISQDRKKIEADNYKKKLEESQKAIEQARLQAQLAQEEAERAVAEAEQASAEKRAEAERIAQEALEKAEAAKVEAENKAREDAERAKEEAEEFKRLAQEEVERAKLEAEEARRNAEEEAERARREAEESRKSAEEEAERARKEAEEAAEKVRKEAEEESERLRQEMEEHRAKVNEEAEKARKEAEEEAERARKEAEEEAEKAKAEAEKAKAEAEEEKRKEAEEEAKRKARIDEKVAKRKEEIAVLRNEIKTITEEEQGNALREKFYQMQLALDEDERSSQELKDLLSKSMDDASHAAELSRYKKLANQKPRRVVKKVTERVNRIPKKPGARPAGARPAARPGARPAGARPAARPGARPAGARPAARPGARPTGARPTSGGNRRPPNGTRPTTKK